MSSAAIRRVLIVAMAAVFPAACGQMPKRPDASLQPPFDAGLQRSPQVEAGEVLVLKRECAKCHSSSAGLLAGSNIGVMGKRVYSPNITPDRATGIGAWTDAQIILSLRFGNDEEGRTLCSEMPREPNLSDVDAANIVAYLRSLPPVTNVTVSNDCQPSDDDVALHGKLVVREHACASCHGLDLSGVDFPVLDTSYPPNLTPDLETGLGHWTKAEVLASVRSGIDDEGEMLCDSMPRYPSLTEDELNAVALFLRRLPPVVHRSPATHCESHQRDGGLQSADSGNGLDAGGASVDAGIPSTDAGLDAGMPTCSGAAVVISQIYGAGGSVGATFKTDFVELHNRTARSVDLTGWALQYASSAGSTWIVAPMPAGQQMAPGSFAVFALAGGLMGAALPGPVVVLSPAINLSGTAGKVALTRSSTPLSGPCPGVGVVDFVGFGGANCSEGSMPTPLLSSTTAALRKALNGLACADSDVNGQDFFVALPSPQQGVSICPCAPSN